MWWTSCCYRVRNSFGSFKSSLRSIKQRYLLQPLDCSVTKIPSANPTWMVHHTIRSSKGPIRVWESNSLYSLVGRFGWTWAFHVSLGRTLLNRVPYRTDLPHSVDTLPLLALFSLRCLCFSLPNSQPIEWYSFRHTRHYSLTRLDTTSTHIYLIQVVRRLMEPSGIPRW